MLATVSGYQDRIVLRDTVWVDETYVNDTDISKGYGQARKRGLSSQRLCICVAIEIHKNPVAVGCGHGKPGSARARKAVGGSMAPGSLLIHDPERARGMLVRDGGLEKEVHRADVSDPVQLGADGDDERPVLLSQALPLALHGDVAAVPACLPRLVRLPLPGQSGQGQMGAGRKGGAPYPDGRRDLPQLRVGAV